MDNTELNTQISKSLNRQEQILTRLDKYERKDGWDKFAIITSFVSGVLLVCMGGAFTYFFQAQQIKRQVVQQKEQKGLEVHRNRLLELDAVSSLLPFLTDPDENKKKAAYLALNTLASTKIVAELAKLNPSEGAAVALSTIAESPITKEKDRKLAASALNDIFLKNRGAVVKVQSYLHGTPSMSSGFFVSSDGYLVTADFAIPKQDGNISIITISREERKVSLVAVNEEYGIAVLKTDEMAEDFLFLGEHPPRIDENVIVIGSTGTEHLISALGRIQRVTDLDLEYWRAQERMAGFAGGPVINKNGRVIGIHRAGWKNRDGSGGIGQCRRADKIRKYLKSLGIKIEHKTRVASKKFQAQAGLSASGLFDLVNNGKPLSVKKDLLITKLKTKIANESYGKIELIKWIRAETGWHLKEAKDFVEGVLEFEKNQVHQ